MSKDVSIFKDKTAVSVATGLSPLAQKLAASGLTTRRIQTNTNGTFKRLVNGEQIGDAIRSEINVIIVNALPKVSRIYYKNKYDPSKPPTMPNCWSNLGDKPEEGAEDPQHANCAECPQNIKGSGETGGRACRFQRRIAVLVEGDASGDVYQFNIPAMSLFGKGSGNTHPFESYIKFLLANGESPDNVVTNISYNINADSMELLFSPQRNINESELHLVTEAMSKPETDMYVKLTVAQTDGAAPVKAEAKPEEPEEPEKLEIEEPTKRAGKEETGTVTAAADSDLASIINDWSSND